MIKVYVVDDSAVVRQTVQQLLQGNAEVELVGSAPNQFSAVRDNSVMPDMTNCVFKRHIHNLIMLNGPSQFTAAYTRTDGDIMNCTNQVTACTTTFEWDLKYTKDFGQ